MIFKRLAPSENGLGSIECGTRGKLLAARHWCGDNISIKTGPGKNGNSNEKSGLTVALLECQ